MPNYTFQCKCGIRFTRNLKMGIYRELECPDCKSQAPILPQEFGSSFKDSGRPRGQDGTAEFDNPTPDKAVGRSAHERWEWMERRNKVKAMARRMGGTNALIRQTGSDYIDYTPMSDATRESRAKLFSDAQKADKLPDPTFNNIKRPQ